MDTGPEELLFLTKFSMDTSSNSPDSMVIGSRDLVRVRERFSWFWDQFLQPWTNSGFPFFQLLEPVLSKASLELVVTQTCAELELPECLVHGQPVARNVFFKTDGNGPGPTMVQALIDWTRGNLGPTGMVP